jgi:hypothetical protein
MLAGNVGYFTYKFPDQNRCCLDQTVHMLLYFGEAQLLASLLAEYFLEDVSGVATH